MTVSIPSSPLNPTYSVSPTYRAVWISDVHLGTRGCKAEALLDFLQHCRTEYLYLVGDIIDGWQLRHRWYWPASHQAIVQEILAQVRRGVKVVFLPGNHDEVARAFLGENFSGIPIINQTIHVTAQNKKLLVLHGDQFDAVIKKAKWLAHIGDGTYTLLLVINAVLNYARHIVGLPYWSLSAHLKRWVKNRVEAISNYEVRVTEAIRAAAADGIVCGHIHHAQMRQMGGYLYCNDGDWVESCTALVEELDGTLRLVEWQQKQL